MKQRRERHHARAAAARAHAKKYTRDAKAEVRGPDAVATKAGLAPISAIVRAYIGHQALAIEYPEQESVVFYRSPRFKRAVASAERRGRYRREATVLT